MLSLLIQAHATKVLIHYGNKSAVDSGLLSQTCKQLEQFKIEYITLGGVCSNPLLSKVQEGIALCKKAHVDFILAIGGGIVIDSAKAIGYGVFNEGDLWDYFLKKRSVQGCLPIGCIR